MFSDQRGRNACSSNPLWRKFFLTEISQLYAQKEALKEDLGDFLGIVLQELPPAAHPFAFNTTLQGLYIDICEDQYRDIRRVLLHHASSASDWILKYMLKSPDVIVSSRKYFSERLRTSWKEDPCDTEEGRHLLNISWYAHPADSLVWKTLDTDSDC